MSFRWFIYYCAVCGGCAAFLGWMLGRVPHVEHHVWQAAVKGVFLGMLLGIVLTLVDVLWHFSGREGLEVCWRVLVAGLVGALGGFAGGMLGQILYANTKQWWFLVLGWAVTGLLIGASPGLYEYFARVACVEEAGSAARKVRNGMIGGVLGGFLGGLVFLQLSLLWEKLLGARVEVLWSPSATGFVALGMCIGLLIGLAQILLKEAWVVSVAGFRKGRELLLNRPEMLIGKAEGCDIPLYGDPLAEKQHARIVRKGNAFFLEDLSVQAGTFVNGKRIKGRAELRAGDLIEVGRSSLRFHERVRRVN